MATAGADHKSVLGTGWITCLRLLVLDFLSLLHTCRSFLLLGHLSWLTYSGSPVLDHLSWIMYPRPAVLGSLSWVIIHSHFGSRCSMLSGRTCMVLPWTVRLRSASRHALCARGPRAFGRWLHGDCWAELQRRVQLGLCVGLAAKVTGRVSWRLPLAPWLLASSRSRARSHGGQACCASRSSRACMDLLVMQVLEQLGLAAPLPRM